MYTFLVIVQVIAAIALIVLVLLQQGKGADAGAAFGSGASSTVFGAKGSANFLSRTTAWLATVFFSVSLALAYVVHGQSAPKSVVDTIQVPVQQAPTTPIVPDEAAPAPVAAPQKDATPKVPG